MNSIISSQNLRGKAKEISYFGWEGADAGAFLWISEGYREGAKVLLEKMESDPCDSTRDMLIYPLFFCHRHSIELLLKALLFIHGDQSDEKRKEYLNCGHNIQKLWSCLKPIIVTRGKDREKSSVNLDEVENHIVKIQNFDSNSMKMRYPVDKKMNPNIDTPISVEFIKLGEEFYGLYELLMRIDHDISNQITAVATDDESAEFLELLMKYREQIAKFLSILEEESKGEQNHEVEVLDSDDLFEQSKKDNFFEQCDSDLRILLYALYESGRKKEIHYSNSGIKKQKEFIKLCYSIMHDEGLSFGAEIEKKQLSISGKVSSVLLKAIKYSMSILDFQI